MARIEFDGLVDLAMDLERIATTPDHVLFEMLEAGADVLVKAQKEAGRAYGVYDSESNKHMIDSISKGKPKRTETGASIYIAPRGGKTSADKGKSERTMASVAFLNEYGTSKQPARPFIRDANEKAADEAIDALEEVYNKWMESNNL